MAIMPARPPTAIEDAANSLAAKDADELIDDTREFVRKSPGVALAGAAIVGFALVRLVKSGPRPGRRSDDERLMLKHGERAARSRTRAPIGELFGQLIDEGKAYAKAELDLAKAIAEAKAEAVKMPAIAARRRLAVPAWPASSCSA